MSLRPREGQRGPLIRTAEVMSQPAFPHRPPALLGNTRPCPAHQPRRPLSSLQRCPRGQRVSCGDSGVGKAHEVIQWPPREFTRLSGPWAHRPVGEFPGEGLSALLAAPTEKARRQMETVRHPPCPPHFPCPDRRPWQSGPLAHPASFPHSSATGSSGGVPLTSHWPGARPEGVREQD